MGRGKNIASETFVLRLREPAQSWARAPSAGVKVSNVINPLISSVFARFLSALSCGGVHFYARNRAEFPVAKFHVNRHQFTNFGTRFLCGYAATQLKRTFHTPQFSYEILAPIASLSQTQTKISL